MELVNIEDLFNKLGIKSETIKAGKYKDLASMFKEMSEKERQILQESLDDIHNQFIQAVAEGRKIPIEIVRQLADGRIFTGAQAYKLKLVDELGTLNDAIDRAAKLVNIKGKPHIVYPEKEFSITDYISNKISLNILKRIPSISINYM
ncbi:signal peptide peptidase SppA, 36K type [Candidatus Magnetoovum chiemensis]|nr:signal peptide peptidase SppA, 36K type [Candidatus Magnetoovum chiemensis]